MSKLHKIRMVNRETKKEIIYKNVTGWIWIEEDRKLYRQLILETGETATFLEKSWDMYDTTECKNWNWLAD